MFLDLNFPGLPRAGNVLVVAAAIFAAGALTGALLSPPSAGRAVPQPAIPSQETKPAGMPLRSGHPARVLRVIDGDTFEARVNIWPGMEITTKVRLRGIDAPEMRASCDREYAQAVAARDELTRLLAEGDVALSRIGQDRYGGRVDADVSTARTVDISAAMLESGLARRYSGGRRGSWCGGQR